MDIDPERIAQSPFVVGAVGGLVALRFAPGLSWVERIGNVCAGAVCAGFLSPAAAEWLRVTASGSQSALAFVIGLFGLSLCAAIMQGLRELKVGAIITDLISRKR